MNNEPFDVNHIQFSAVSNMSKLCPHLLRPLDLFPPVPLVFLGLKCH